MSSTQYGFQNYKKNGIRGPPVKAIFVRVGLACGMGIFCSVSALALWLSYAGLV